MLLSINCVLLSSSVLELGQINAGVTSQFFVKVLSEFLGTSWSHVSHVSDARFYVPIAPFAGNTLDSTTFPPNLQCSSIDDNATAFKPVPRSGKL